jgi:hypothetical protein
VISARQKVTKGAKRTGQGKVRCLLALYAFTDSSLLMDEQEEATRKVSRLLPNEREKADCFSYVSGHIPPGSSFGRRSSPMQADAGIICKRLRCLQEQSEHLQRKL